MTNSLDINYRIIGLDPGGTTGWAMFSAQRMWDSFSNKMEYYNPQFTCGYIGPNEHHEELENLIETFEVESTLVITESFEFRNRHRDNVELISREYIGVTKLICIHRKLHLLQQTASIGKITDKSFVRKEHLVKLGLWMSPYNTWKHSMDAYGHILYYMIHNGIYDKELLRLGWS